MMDRDGVPYSVAARALAIAERPAPPIDPQLLAPYPHELIRPADADERWKPPTTAELGWRVLPADATPQQRAVAESYWRPVTAGLPCRCTGPCHHGEECDGEEQEGCPGRLWHGDRRAHLGHGPLVWRDFYVCDTCGDELEDVVETQVPWGEVVDGGLREYPGIRSITVLPADWQCDECGAANQYHCNCRYSQDQDECEECGATGPYDCGCHD